MWCHFENTFVFALTCTCIKASSCHTDIQTKQLKWLKAVLKTISLEENLEMLPTQNYGSTGKKGVWMKANYRQFLIQLNKVKLTASNSKMWPFLHLKYIFTLCKVFNYAHSYQIPSICKSWVTCIKNKEKKKKRVDCCSLQTPVRTCSYAFIFFPRHIKNQSQGKNLLYSLHSFYSLLYLYFKTGISAWHISQKCYSKSVEILVL